MPEQNNNDVWQQIEESIDCKLKKYKFIKKEINILKSLDFNLINEWYKESYNTNLGKVFLYFKDTFKGTIIINVLEERIQNISFGSNNKDDLIGLIGSFFVKTILDWY